MILLQCRIILIWPLKPINASNNNGCIAVHLSVSSTGPEEMEHHPERRMKAAYTAYEEANMPRLKKENPNMRLSQLKQQLKKEWMKAPENPLNQRFAAYNSK